MAQPRNLFRGDFISAIVGKAIYKIIPDFVWINAPLALAISIVGMQITKTMHPPGPATALIAVTSSEQIKSLGFVYTFPPILTVSWILLILALVCNSMTVHRHYPTNKKFTHNIKRFFLK